MLKLTMVIRANINGEIQYFILPEHAEERFMFRNISVDEIRNALEQPDEVFWNIEGRQEYLTKRFKVVVDLDEDGYYDGIIVTVHLRG